MSPIIVLTSKETNGDLLEGFRAFVGTRDFLLSGTTCIPVSVEQEADPGSLVVGVEVVFNGLSAAAGINKEQSFSNPFLNKRGKYQRSW